MYSVDTEEEARNLLVLACPTNVNGEFVAPELAEEQTLDNLNAFSERLHRAHQLLKDKGFCTCATTPPKLPRFPRKRRRR